MQYLKNKNCSILIFHFIFAKKKKKMLIVLVLYHSSNLKKNWFLKSLTASADVYNYKISEYREWMFNRKNYKILLLMKLKIIVDWSVYRATVNLC